jgi:lysophospholipase L1-like esterase
VHRQTGHQCHPIHSHGAAEGTLAGKSIYAFGDSIVRGHQYSRGFVDFVAEQEGMALKVYAVNGATIGPTSNQIIDQVKAADSRAPDFVVFDGGTNDAEQVYRGEYEVGAVCIDSGPQHFDTSSYAGAFEATAQAMKQKWPAARIVYVCAHKLGSRDWGTQVALRDVTLKAATKWTVAVADTFAETSFDTRVEAQRAEFTFDELENGCPGTDGTGTHPNIAGITRFYVPVLAARLAQLQRQ